MAKDKIPENNTECSSEQHSRHLCFLMNNDFHHTNKEEFQEMVSVPEFICKNCSQTAKEAANLCNPEKL
jgi:hypothetical protein